MGTNKPIRQEWYFLDFQKKVILFSGSQEVPYTAIPANKAMNSLLLTLSDRLTFREYKEYLEENNIKDRIYHFDGRSKKTVMYEPLEVNYSDFLFFLKYFPPQPCSFTVGLLREEIYRLCKKKKEGGDKRLVDIAKNQLENILDLLKKC